MEVSPVQVTRAQIDAILAVLEKTPRDLAFLTAGLESDRPYAKPDQDTWSVNEILAHLRACADVWGKSIGRMISQDHPTIRYVSPRTWLGKTDYPAQDFRVSLQAFDEQRHDLLIKLKALALADWSRGATFAGTTRGREQTILSYVQRMADHETRHLDQIKRVLNAVLDN